MDHDLARAKQMLATFTGYLRASLTTLRSDSRLLAHELELAQSHLLLQSRMAGRLVFSITADEAPKRLNRIWRAPWLLNWRRRGPSCSPCP